MDALNGHALPEKIRSTYVIGFVCLFLIFILLNAPFPSINREETISFTTTEDIEHNSCKFGDAFRVLLNDKKYPDARCVDGSKPAYYLRKGTGSGIKKWLVYYEGGGWCYNYTQCAHRALTDLGSSKKYPECLTRDRMNFYLSSREERNPLMYNWNTVHVRYCDGTSYAGDASFTLNKTTLHFRGKANRDSTIMSLVSTYGMSEASEVVLAGCSAGALGLFLGIDQLATIITRANKAIRVSGLADSGFFLDYTGDKNYANPRKGMTSFAAIIDGVLDFSNTMKNTYKIFNISSGTNPSCVKTETEKSRQLMEDLKSRKLGIRIPERVLPVAETENCIFSQNLGFHIKTPLFLIQVRFWSWL
jgi:hypothetical protein